jgi:hypothetical protein
MDIYGNKTFKMTSIFDKLVPLDHYSLIEHIMYISPSVLFDLPYFTHIYFSIRGCWLAKGKVKVEVTRVFTSTA